MTDERVSIQSVEGILASARQKDIKLWIAGGELRYSAPQGAMNSETLAVLREQKEAIMDALRAEVANSPSEPQLIERATEGRHPLTFLQESWVTRYSSVSARNIHLISCQRCFGNLQMQLLVESLRYMTRRHAALRARIGRDDEGYHLVVAEEIEIPIGVMDVQVEAVEDAVARFSAPLFDLHSGPLLRLGVGKCQDESNLLVIVAHHAIADGWSLAVIWRELIAYYNAVKMGISSPTAMASRPIQITDFMHFKREWLKSNAAERARQYWKKRLNGCEAPFDLPYDRKTPVNWNSPPGPVCGRLNVAQSTKLAVLCKANAVSLANLVLTGFVALLVLWSGRKDIVVWVCHSGRRQRAAFNAVGCFFDTWLLRTDVDREVSFRSALETVCSEAIAVMSMLDLTGSEMVGQYPVNGGVDLRRVILFNFIPEEPRPLQKPQETEGCDPTADGTLAIAPEELNQPTGYLDSESTLGIVLTVHGNTRGIRWALQHDPEVFEDSTVTHISAAFQRILDEAGTDPDRSLSAWQQHVWPSTNW